MASEDSDNTATPATPEPLKILISGGPGTGKTTLIGAVSEIRPLTTEAETTVSDARGDAGATSRIGTGTEAEADTDARAEAEVGAEVDAGDPALPPEQERTTIALNFGRRSFPEHHMVLYLFGTPGQDRFGFLWKLLAHGAIGALVLVDTRRPHVSRAAVEFFERHDIPFVIGENRFDDAPRCTEERIRAELKVKDPATPIVSLDARDRASSRDALIDLLRLRIRRA